MGFFSRYCADIGFRRGGCSVRLGMQIANVKQRQILPRVSKIWVSTPQNRTYA